VIRELKDKYNWIGLDHICRLLGISRQAYYQNSRFAEQRNIELGFVLQQVLAIREKHKLMGGRKLYKKLQAFLVAHQIKMGRDALFTLLSANGLLVKRRKRKVYTTNSFHWLRKYPNLIKNFNPNATNQLWVSDITYLKIATSYLYISLVTDAYSHKIVGYNVANNLEAIQTTKALKMALKSLKKLPDNLIHHSDRGLQYCSYNYTGLLKENDIAISMTESGDPLENPLAERINGILKMEYLEHYDNQNLEVAKRNLTEAVYLYNNERPHFSIGLLTPNKVHHNKEIKPQNLWK